MPVTADAVQGLLDALEQALAMETDALRTRDIAALGQAVSTKQRMLRALGAIPPAVIAADPRRAVFTAALGRCRARNETAGAAIAALRQETRQALDLLGIDGGASDYGSPGRPVRAGRALAIC